MMECVICGDELNLGREMCLDHDCGHYSHARCHSVDDGDLECAQCKPTSLAAQCRPELTEPAWQGADWVTCDTGTNNIASKVWSRVKDVGKRDAEDIETPLTLIQMKKPIEWIIRNKKLGLGHLFNAGVRLDDFLKNGYTLKDLCIFQDIGHRGPQRGLLAMQRLGLNPDHLIEYNVQLPIAEMRECFELTPAKICNRAMGGGLGFHSTDGLRTPRSTQWFLEDVLYLGFEFQDLVACGLWCRDHLDKMGHITRDHLKLLKCTQADIDLLSAAAAAAAAPAQQQQQQQTPQTPQTRETPVYRRPVINNNNNNNNLDSGRKLRILK
jgi:hypothetical protein